MSFLITAMSHYTCTRCGRSKTTMSTQKTLPMKCCDGENPIEHKRTNPEDLSTSVKNAKVEIVPPAPLQSNTGMPLPQPPVVHNPSAQAINMTVTAGADSPVTSHTGEVLPPGSHALGSSLQSGVKQVEIKAPANNPPVSPTIKPIK